MELMAGATDGILSPSDVMEQECWGSGLQPSSRQDLPAALSSNHCASQQALFPRLPSPFLSSLIPCFILLPVKFMLLSETLRSRTATWPQSAGGLHAPQSSQAG